MPGDPNAPELPAADPGGDTEAGAQLPSANESSSEAGNSQEDLRKTVQKTVQKKKLPSHKVNKGSKMNKKEKLHRIYLGKQQERGCYGS